MVVRMVSDVYKDCAECGRENAVREYRVPSAFRDPTSGRPVDGYRVYVTYTCRCFPNVSHLVSAPE